MSSLLGAGHTAAEQPHMAIAASMLAACASAPATGLVSTLTFRMYLKQCLHGFQPG
jgi:hypothetical protein